MVDDPRLRTAVDDLIASRKKRRTPELDRGPRLEAIGAFIEAELAVPAPLQVHQQAVTDLRHALPDQPPIFRFIESPGRCLRQVRGSFPRTARLRPCAASHRGANLFSTPFWRTLAYGMHDTEIGAAGEDWDVLLVVPAP